MGGTHLRQMAGTSGRHLPAPAGGRATPLPTYGKAARLSPVVVAGTVRIAEAVLLAAVGLLVHSTYVLPRAALDGTYLLAIGTVPVLAVAAFGAVGAYSLGALRSLPATAVKLACAWSLVLLAVMATLFFLKTGELFSRGWLGGWYLGGLAALVALRFGVARWVGRMTRAGRFDRRTAIVGGGEPADAIIRALQAQPECGLRIVGVYDDRDDERSPRLVGGYEKLGGVSDLVEHARRAPFDLVIFTLPISAENRLLEMLRKLWVLPVDIRLSAHSAKLKLRPRSYSYLGSVPVLDLFDRPIADWDLAAKWLFDKVVGSLLLIAASPILLLAAIAVKLDSRGPILFRQKRYGFNNELIEVYKFRSMYTEATDAAASRLVTRGDPRVTRVGRFLRRSSIDELPQLFNVVFKGNLSLVGPRPHALQAKAESRLYDQVVDGYFARHRVKPGLTGWAQINGWRGETDTELKLQRRVEHDLFYIENWSVLFDVYIVAATPFALIKTDGAY